MAKYDISKPHVYAHDVSNKLTSCAHSFTLSTLQYCCPWHLVCISFLGQDRLQSHQHHELSNDLDYWHTAVTTGEAYRCPHHQCFTFRMIGLLHEYLVSAVIANFYAPWCPWCQRLEPTWEAVREEVHAKYPDTDGRIHLAKVYCYSPKPAATTASSNDSQQQPQHYSAQSHAT